MRTDIRIMDELRRAPAEAEKLARQVHISRATVSRALRRLSEDGFVRKLCKRWVPIGRPADVWELVA